MEKKTHNYVIERSYQYESQDKDGKFNGLSIDDWKKRIRDEWTADKLKANHVTYIFHDKDRDSDGNLKPIHVHGCVNFQNSIPETNALKLTGCSRQENCTPMKSKSGAYRYLLHISEKAIKDKKYIYGEDCLEYSVAQGKKVDFHKLIMASETEEKTKEDAKKIIQIVEAIRRGQYGDGSFLPLENTLRDNVLLDDEVNRLMSIKPSYRRMIENAIEIKQDTYRVTQKNNKQ